MTIFDRYLFRQILTATVLTATALAGIIMLTQSLRFLELVVNAGASGSSFWLLTLMALPRFFEIILPIALMASVVFVYNRLNVDNELTALRGTGVTPLRLARPALIVAMIITVMLWGVTMWLAPVSVTGLQHLRQVIKAQYSSLLFHEGVFSSVRPGLTVFMHARAPNGELQGLMIHDSREENKDRPVTIMAKSGQVVFNGQGQQVLVYNGSRQDINPGTGALNRLDFERYTIDLPESSLPVRERWREPDERTFSELLSPDPYNARDASGQREFTIEIHRRIVGPLLALSYTAVALAMLLTGPLSRHGQGWRIFCATGTTIVIQSLYLASFSFSRHHDAGFVLMYALIFLPLIAGLALLHEKSESLRRRLFYRFRGWGAS